MADVARAAGVHQTTVSRALSNDHRIPDATRLRIQGIAKKMNYRVNPLVSALIALRRSGQPPRFNATIAFVAHQGLSDDGREHLAAARAMAEHRGYRVELFTLGGKGFSEARLNAILHARNIHGAIVAPLPEAHGGFRLDWDRLCSIAIEHTFTSPALDRVVHDLYSGMRTIMHECRRRVLHRVGLVLSTNGHDRTDRLNGAAYWIEQKSGRFFPVIPPLIQPTWHAATFDAWYQRHRPEAIVTSNSFLADVVRWCSRRRLRIGRDLQLINVNAKPAGSVSGIVQNHRVIGATAARLVIEKITNNERGISESCQISHIRGTWLEGTSLRAAPLLGTVADRDRLKS